MHANIVRLSLLVCAVAGCSHDASPPPDACATQAGACSLDESRRVLATRGDTYAYTRRSEPSNTASWTETTVRVRGGVVVGRDYAEKTSGGVGMAPVVLDAFSEGPGELGGHAAGAPASTLPMIYDECTRILDEAPSAASITLEFDAAGILERCSYWAPSCVEGCAVGITLTEVRFGE